MGKLVLNAKPDEEFVLYDEKSGLTTVIRPFYRDGGGLAVAFDAPSEVKISRQRRSADSGDKRKN